jgi:DNA adenine methylase
VSKTLLRAPFPWFGGKSRVASIVWERFGHVRNYVEPFAGSLAVLLGRPAIDGVETVNDANAYIANFWRALASDRADPDAVAYYADWPVNEADLHARHRWLVESAADRVERIMSDPDYFDAKVAGWWVWGQCLWIGSGWCTARKNFRADRSGGRTGALSELTQRNAGGGQPNRASQKKRPVLAYSGGRGVHRTSTHGGEEGDGLARQIVDLSGDSGASGRGVHASGFDMRTGGLYAYMRALAERLRRTRVCCGQWTRIITPAVTTCIGITAVLLDPPYHGAGTDRSLVYSHEDGGRLWNDVKEWAVAHGDDPNFRIALCGYEGDHGIPDTWDCVTWTAAGGYGRTVRGRNNRQRERIWFSPHCLDGHQHELLAT